MNITTGVSIIICCHNGARRLPQTIRCIAEQQVPSYIPCEFILVDNGSTDDSASIAQDQWALYKTNFEMKIVSEECLGLSHARQKGFAAAQYEYIIMCDDDNWLAEDYVDLTYQIMSKHPKIGALGGFGKIVYEVSPPGYLEFCNIFAAGEQAPRNGRVPLQRLYGAGCVVRKSAIQKLESIGFKSLLSDRKGVDLSSGGDYELCYAISILGYDIWYDNRLQFSHFITKERLNWDYFMRYAKESNICFDVLASYASLAINPAINKWPLVFISRNFFYFFRRFIIINMKRFLHPEESDYGKTLYFRHTVLKYKLKAYFTRFGEMLKIHRTIIAFSERCKKIAPQKRSATLNKIPVDSFEITSASKPYQQLQ